MCFSENGSLAIGTVGILSGIYFYYTKHVYASIGICYFALMEILQFFQYRVIDQCSNDYNKFLTIIGYIHICFQPLFINIWLFEFTKNPNFLFLYMSFFAGLLLLSRIVFVKDADLCSENEPLCGKRTCSFSGKRHIAWNIRMRSPAKYWFTPSMGLHCFMWIMPALLSFQFKPILAMLISMPYIPYILNGGIWSNIHEHASIWCYTEIAQLIVTFILLR